MKPATPPKVHPEIETVRLVWLAIFISVFSFLYYNRHGDLLLYGDAVAHINIARRVFDSRTPGLLQLGTVWLPLPHLLILPFIVSKHLWQTGAGGSVPSMAGSVFGVLGLFRLVRGTLVRVTLDRAQPVDATTAVTAWAAVILYAANPNLIYLQATAMGESLYLAFFIWAVLFFTEFARGEAKALTRCAWCLAAACLTRYDGWFLAAVLVLAVVIVACLGKKSEDARQIKDAEPGFTNPASRTAIIKFVLIVAAAPSLWLAYNAAVYRNPLEFANGPYSARAIEQKTATVNPAKGNLFAAGSYFLKAAGLNVANSTWLQRLWLALALLGSAVSWFNPRSRPTLLLWAPLPFYALSVAYGSVPIFVPTWWPFSYYNLRYGLQLLPAFAVFIPVGISFLVTKFPAARLSTAFIEKWTRWSGAVTFLCPLLLAAASYGAIWRADPVCYREAAINSRGRVALDGQIANWIKFFPPNSTLLMYLGEHSGAVEQSGMPLRRVINEGNHRVWRQPVDVEGLWERALADPAAYADYIVAVEGDPVWTSAAAHHLTPFVEIHTLGQPPAEIFQGRVLQSSPIPHR